ncbi:unnamed protein product [Mytilus coruscus]|uniref:OTU domain-containing protein n=1 Tax=Mytilus coruscus TaxID=42192 RepID=A0A6J8E282_MYTCO|nr:unnamed protein product [Mytilus coruscus]
MYSKKESEERSGVNTSHVEKWVVQGSFHQGNKRFGMNSGKQCVANCLSALAHSKLKDLDNRMFLDNVLIKGNNIYSNIHGDNDYLLVSDLPQMIEILEKIFILSLKESITAVVDINRTVDFSAFGNSLPLDQALQESLIDYDACFICAYDTTFLAFKHNQDLILFDSHARNEFGLKDGNGKSLLLKLSNLDHLYQYCCNMMAGTSQNQLFEVTGVCLNIYGQKPESHKPVLTSTYEFHKIIETPNRNSYEKNDEFTKTQENINLIDNISPEILECSIDNCNDIKEINEVHSHENIINTESDVEILSSTDVFYDFKPLNSVSKRKLCTIVKIPTKNISQQSTQTICNIGPPTATKTITGDGNCLFRAISYALSNRQEFFGTIRKAIVYHMTTNAEMFKSFLHPRFKTVEEHI